MSLTSCVRHPANARFLKVYQWQIDFCDGNTCAAALLSHFEFCHNWKLAHLAEARLRGVRDSEILWQWHTNAELEKSVIFYKRDKITEGIRLLESKGVIELHVNPASVSDRTRFFLFLPEVVNEWIDIDLLRSCEKSHVLGEITEFPRNCEKSNLELRKIVDGTAKNRSSTRSKNTPKNTDKEIMTTTAREPVAKRKVRRGSRVPASSSLPLVFEEGKGAKKSPRPPVAPLVSVDD